MLLPPPRQRLLLLLLLPTRRCRCHFYCSFRTVRGDDDCNHYIWRKMAAADICNMRRAGFTLLRYQKAQQEMVDLQHFNQQEREDCGCRICLVDPIMRHGLCFPAEWPISNAVSHIEQSSNEQLKSSSAFNFCHEQSPEPSSEPLCSIQHKPSKHKEPLRIQMVVLSIACSMVTANHIKHSSPPVRTQISTLSTVIPLVLLAFQVNFL